VEWRRWFAAGTVWDLPARDVGNLRRLTDTHKEQSIQKCARSFDLLLNGHRRQSWTVHGIYVISGSRAGRVAAMGDLRARARARQSTAAAGTSCPASPEHAGAFREPGADPQGGPGDERFAAAREVAA